MESDRSNKFIGSIDEVTITPPSIEGTTTRTGKTKLDGQMSGLAGEFFVAAELLKRGIQTSVSFGNAKAIDLFAHNERTGQRFTIQVKSLRRPNYFLIDPEKVHADHTYVFVLLNEPGKPVQYFILRGHDLLDRTQDFGNSFKIQKMPGILPGKLKQFEDNWKAFEEVQRDRAI